MRGKTKKVLEYLKTNKNITQLEAWELFKASRLSSIIFNLKKYGYKIISKPESYTDEDGKKSYYVRYVYEGEDLDER
jgi:hypothetical protein